MAPTTDSVTSEFVNATMSDECSHHIVEHATCVNVPSAVKINAESEKLANYPRFLCSYDDFYAHVFEYFDDLSNTERGGRFASFAAKLIPFVPEFADFGEPKLSDRKSHDGGVDILTNLDEMGRQLFAQAKLTIAKKDDIDGIFSKFQAFESDSANIAQPSLFPQDNDGDRQPVFVVVTSSKLDGIIARYRESSLSSRPYYDRLIAEKRVHIIDGPRIFALLQSAYSKAYNIPSEVKLSSPVPWIRHGNVLLGFLPAEALVELHRMHGDSIFFENIRDFLGRTSGHVVSAGTVNEDITDTIQSAPEKFAERNNGITFKAKGVALISATDLSLSEASIVNGCQTTMCLVTARDPIDKCVVQVKVIESQDAWDVAKAANYQNHVDRIELELARFIRPQIVRMVATETGFDVDTATQATAIGLLGGFYDAKVRYDEVKSLYVGIMSNTPNNLGDQLYTKLRGDLLEEFTANQKDQKDFLETLFLVVVQVRKAIEECKEFFSGEDFADPFLRVFEDRKPAYRIFLAIVTLCALLDTDLSHRSDDRQEEFARMRKFIQDIRHLIESRSSEFQNAYMLAFETFATEARMKAADDGRVRQHLANVLSRGFTTLYNALRLKIKMNKKLAEMSGH